MALQRIPKMSLVAQFDDLCRYTKILTSGTEEEFKSFAENQLNYVRKLKKADSEVKKLRNRISTLESENGRLETKIKHLKNLLEDADATRRKTEWEKKGLENMIAAVKEILLSGGIIDNQTREKLAFLNSSYRPSFNSPPHLQTIEESVGSLFSLSDIDQTDDDLEDCRRSSNRRGQRSKGKRSGPESRNSVKKKKTDEAEEFLNRINRGSCQQSSSEPTSSSPEIPVPPAQTHRLDSAQFRFNTQDFKHDADSTPVNTPVSRPASFKQFSKNHQFVSKKVIKSVKCLPCRQNIGYLKQSLRCQTCGITCHPECKNMCPMLCFPITNTPTKGTAGTVADYTSSSSPMIPPLIVHCIREIEFRGLKEVGLYRVSASERDVRNLKEKFVSGRIIPCLSDVDIHALCVTVKEFLRSLNEPIITRKLWQAFVDAANLRDGTESSYALLGLVSNLPQPNRDTLSFLILHWQKVSESPQCKMDIENLAKVLGPTVVGYSTAEPAKANMLEETSSQYQVMKKLLSISTDSWQSMLSVEMFQSIEGTPENLPAPKETRLGPIYSYVHQKRKSLTLRKTPLTPRNSKFKGTSYFASPIIK